MQQNHQPHIHSHTQVQPSVLPLTMHGPGVCEFIIISGRADLIDAPPPLLVYIPPPLLILLLLLFIAELYLDLITPERASFSSKFSDHFVRTKRWFLSRTQTSGYNGKIIITFDGFQRKLHLPSSDPLQLMMSVLDVLSSEENEGVSYFIINSRTITEDFTTHITLLQVLYSFKIIFSKWIR